MPGSPLRTAVDAFLVGAATGPLVEIFLAFGVPALWWILASVAAVAGLIVTRFVPFLLWVFMLLVGLFSFAAAAAFLALGHI